MASNKLGRRRRKELSLRQMKLIKARAEGKTYAQAAIEAGYSPKHAAQNGYQALSQIRGRVQDLLDRQGLDENTAIEKYLKPLLEARETVFFQKNGKVTATRKVEALAIRLNALKELFLLHGSYAPRCCSPAARSDPAIRLFAFIHHPINSQKDVHYHIRFPRIKHSTASILTS
jgi:hypothetical protein